VPRLRISGAVPLLPIHAFMMWAAFPCLIKYEGKNAAMYIVLILIYTNGSVSEVISISTFRLQGYEEICTLFSRLVEGLSYPEQKV